MIYTDQLHRAIEIKKFPQKIISLVPSQTEFLYDIGLENQLAGITKFCIHPEKIFHSKPRVGGTKKLDFEKIKAIDPDLIIGNKEENNKEQIEELMKHYPVWMSDIKTLEDSFEMMSCIGEITGKKSEARQIKEEIKSAFEKYFPADKNSFTNQKNAAYLIWNNPYMTINKDTFIHSMMIKAGFKNVFADETLRYPVISLEDLQMKKPGYVLLSSEPFPFNNSHVAMLRHELPGVKILLVDGELFSWYGSRLRYSPEYLYTLAIIDNERAT